jgi:hypothetical protein
MRGSCFDPTYIIESSGPGLVANDIRVQNAAYGYLVFRPKNARMAAGAGTCAKMMFDIHCRNQNMTYSLGGAIMSLFGRDRGSLSRSDFDALFEQIISGSKHQYFCSQFVVYIYQFVAEQLNIPARTVFPYLDAKVSPSKLAMDLAGNSNFSEAGYLMPHER